MTTPPPPQKIRFIVLQDEKKRGSLAIANIKLYYQPSGLV